jgi:cytochrome c oxidase subunit III
MSEGQSVNEGGAIPAFATPGDSALPFPPAIGPATRLTPGQWGILTFLCSEVAFFSTLIMTYVIFIGRDSQPGGMGGPTPREVLSLGLVCVTTVCLLSSSVTVHLAERALLRNHRSRFIGLWAATIALGAIFLAGTAVEWNELINRNHLTIGRNLFGTTYYTLVGFHAFHVTVGVIIMLLILTLTLSSNLAARSHASVKLVSWYWHFVDGVWIVVFSVVYLYTTI